MLVKIEELRLYREKIKELLEAAPDHSELLQSVIEDLQFAESDGKTAVAITAVKQSESALEKLSSQLGQVDNSAKSVASIIASAKAILGTFNWLS